MHGYLRLKDAFGRKLIKSNDVFRKEVDRWFRTLVQGDGVNARVIFMDLFFKGGHTYDVINTLAPYDTGIHIPAPGATQGMSSAGNVHRARYTASKFYEDFPDSVTRVAFALGRVGVTQWSSSGTLSPLGIQSSTDFAQNQIGTTYGHPINRRAFFPETAIAPSGFGQVTIGGALALASNEEGHYIYGLEIIEAGDDGSGTGAEYIFWRRPYYIGAFEAESGETDFTGTGSGVSRWPAATTNERASINFVQSIPDLAGQPAELPQTNGYPTTLAQTDNAGSVVSGMVCDGLTPSRIWYCMVDAQFTDNINATRSRSLWTWDRMAGLPPIRRDADDDAVSGGIASFPAFGSGVQFRDLEQGRGGWIWLAADGDDDENRGTNTGGLVQINANTLAIKDVFGEAAGGIYTAGTLRQNNCLAVAVDQSESYAAAGHDRVWVLHRNGLSYADFNTTTGNISGSWVRIADAGADQNVLAAGSIRGIACFTNGAPGDSLLNGHPPFMDVDHNGDVFWVSTTGTEFDTGKQRLNRLKGDLSTVAPGPAAHHYYTLDEVAEGGAQGFIDLGDSTIGTGSTCVVGSFRMRRADPGDPEGSDLWLACARGNVGDKIIFRIPTSDFAPTAAIDNPGAHFLGSKVFSAMSGNNVRLWVTPDGQACADTSNNQLFSIYQSREVSAATNPASSTIDQFDAASGGIQRIHRDTGSGDAWTADLVGKRIRIPGASSNVNRGSFVVDAFIDADTLDLRNAGGTLEASPAAVSCDFAGAEFEDIGINSTNTLRSMQAYKSAWPRGDDSGVGYFWQARSGSVAGAHYLWTGMRVHYMWSGSVWYRKALPHPEAAYGQTRTASTAANALKSGVTAAFLNQNAGTNEFLAGEYYTCGASTGIIKDPTQELTVNYDFFSEQTDLQDESGIDLTASDGPLAAFRNTEDLTVNDPTTTALTFNELQLGHYQRRILLDGNNGTTLKQATGTRNTTNGFSVGIDLGAAVAVDRVMFSSLCNNVAYWDDILLDLYYSDDNATYTLADSYDALVDHPEWLIYPDAFRNNANTPNKYQNENVEIEVDVGLIGGAAATPHRYWKLVVRCSSSQSAAHTLGSFTCIDTTGAAAGFPAANKLGTADDSNYLANMISRAVFVQDTGTGTAARGPGTDQVTLTADTFDSVAIDDFFRVLSGPEAGFEAKILSVDSGTQITLVKDAPSFSAVDWEVVRDVDVRPRDDEGASENQARFPSAAGEVFLCSVTGYIFYHADDVTASRVMRLDEYVKVRRAL